MWMSTHVRSKAWTPCHAMFVYSYTADTGDINYMSEMFVIKQQAKTYMTLRMLFPFETCIFGVHTQF